MSKFKAAIGNQLTHHPLRFFLLATVISILIGTIFYHFVERLAWLDAVYFSVITLTTVGYGDISPQTDAGKIFTIVYIFNGLGIIFGFINVYYDYRRNRIEEMIKKKGNHESQVNAE